MRDSMGELVDKSDRLFGLGYVLTRFHSGQWSQGYRVLCRLRIRWGSDDASRLLPRDEWSGARVAAAHYIRLIRSGEIRP